MKRCPLLFLVLAACSQGERQQPEQAQQPQPSDTKADAKGASGSLTGLYEGGGAERPDQLCMVERKSGEAHFGLVVWGANMNSCSGIGLATRQNGSLRLAMAGDSECVIKAGFEGGRVSLPATLPAGCAYYCGAQAKLASASFTRKAGTKAAALEAKDLVGDSLCQGL